MSTPSMQRSQIYLSQQHLQSLAAHAAARRTTQSALIREALDIYLGQQPPVDKRAALAHLFGAWRDMPEQVSLEQLRREERQF